MDKRTLLFEKNYFLSDGTSLPVKVYEKKSGKMITARAVYGELEIYAHKYSFRKDIDKLVAKAINLYSDRILNRPFYKENVYIYQLGEKKYFTNDLALKNDSRYFYISKNTKDPLTKYKKEFLSNITPRLIELGRRMGVDLTGWKVRTGLFLSYYGVCFPKQHQMKFDYRLFAYPSYISDAILIHEIAHIFEIKHNERFYTIVKCYCPDYDHLIDEIEKGHFEGGLDNYGFPRN